MDIDFDALGLIDFNTAIDKLDIKGGKYLAKLLFKGKLLRVGKMMYLTKEQFAECMKKDEEVLSNAGKPKHTKRNNTTDYPLIQ